MKEQRLLGGPLCLCICFASPIQIKNKEQYLGMSINNLSVLEKS